jgi:hypothetical protein
MYSDIHACISIYYIYKHMLYYLFLFWIHMKKIKEIFLPLGHEYFYPGLPLLAGAFGT